METIIDIIVQFWIYPYLPIKIIYNTLIYIIISKKYPRSPLKLRGLGASFMTRTLQLRFREFGAPIIYMIPVPLLT